MLQLETNPSLAGVQIAHASSSRAKAKRVAAAILLAATVGAFAPAAFAQNAPICVNPPPIGGTPSVGAAPAGWSVASNTPDIIAGNGTWPGGGYTISDISGPSTSGGSMGLFLNESTGYVESWQTVLTGLTAGVTYQVAIEWQQASLTQIGGGRSWSGGTLRMSVDGNASDYTAAGTAASDTWQVATKNFVATGPTAVFVLGKTPTTGLNGMVVADSGAACSIVVPQVETPIVGVPTLSVFGLGGMALSAAMWGAFALRNRRRPDAKRA
jgi:hypothetical protein